ncbi:MAG: hypothetical protein EOM42_06760 [Negativicutes bacterium]|nr:hypothetical protein [Negativicutes bacterium]
MIHVIDSIMGSGKTSYIIQRLNKSHEENERNGFTDEYEHKRYIVATPYLDQITAIKSKVPHGKEVKDTSQSKSDNLVKLLTQLSHLKNSFESLLLLRSSYFQYRP